MPLIHIEMLEGRSVDQKRVLVAGLTNVAAQALACPPDHIQIVIDEKPKAAWAIGGQLVSDRN